ncbi:DNA mismatch repair protein [Gamsiella multidivaricata]|nr:DNA mismatch repair protein [Gamsiella multidivaricata]
MTEMSLVDIVSRPQDQRDVYSVIFKGGERLFCGPSSKYPRFNHGTTVSVRDLFYKFPVRQRYWSEASASKLELELDKVKRAVETFALVSPRISFTVIDMAKDAKVMTYRKADSQLHRITAVLGLALSSSLTFAKSSPEDTTYSLSGYISTMGHYNRLYQYIFLNNRPIRSDIIQRTITQTFQQSSFSKESLRFDEDVRRSRERYPVYVLTLKCPLSEYDICMDPAKVTVEFEDEERVLRVVRDTIIAFLERQHLLSRSAASTLRNQSTTRKRKSRAKGNVGLSDESVPLGYLSRIKLSRPSRASKAPQYSQGDAYQQEEIDVEDELEFELDEDWISSMLDDDFVSSEVEYNRQDSSDIMLPNSGLRRASLPHVVESRSTSFITGTSGIWAQDALRKWVNPLFPTPPTQVPSLQTLNLDTGMGDAGKRESIEKSVSRFFSRGAGCQDQFNIKRLQLSKTCLQHARVIAQLDRKFILCTMDAAATATAQLCSPRSTVLVVVDQHAADERVRVERLMKEMCVCSCATLESTIHAMEELSQASEHRLDSMAMIPPLPITLSRREWRLVEQYSDWLSRWGIILDKNPLTAAVDTDPAQLNEDSIPLDEDDDTLLVSHHFSDSLTESSQTMKSHSELQQAPITATAGGNILVSRHITASDYSQGWVTVLPRAVADRCVVDGALTQDLIKDSISWAEGSRYSSRRDQLESHSANDDASSWLRCIRGCPRGILDIVNSKACRGAIMFNDKLSLAQCEGVVRSLAECKFPFQCAHGRPSIVPLTILDQTMPHQQKQRSRSPSKLASFKKHQRKTLWTPWMRNDT